MASHGQTELSNQTIRINQGLTHLFKIGLLLRSFPCIATMLNLIASNSVDRSVLGFLQQHPALSDLLIDRLGQSVSQVATLIEPVIQAASRGERHYLQAIVIETQAFLVTNLPDFQTALITEVSSSWILGRSATCAISIPNKAVSRRHAVIGYMHSGQFYIMDLGSSNGTRLNHKKLPPLRRQALQDGDIIELCNVQAEFLLSELPLLPTYAPDTMF